MVHRRCASVFPILALSCSERLLLLEHRSGTSIFKTSIVADINTLPWCFISFPGPRRQKAGGDRETRSAHTTRNCRCRTKYEQTSVSIAAELSPEVSHSSQKQARVGH